MQRPHTGTMWMIEITSRARLGRTIHRQPQRHLRRAPGGPGRRIYRTPDLAEIDARQIGRPLLGILWTKKTIMTGLGWLAGSGCGPVWSLPRSGSTRPPPGAAEVMDGRSAVLSLQVQAGARPRRHLRSVTPGRPRPESAVTGPLTAAGPVGGLDSLLSGDRRHERVSDAECQVLWVPAPTLSRLVRCRGSSR
jgi:hypothetical protein